MPIPSDSDITFAEDVLVGFAGCNRFRASYTMSEGEIEVGSIVTTKVLCDEQTMEHERNFLQTLRSPHYYEVQDSSLVIMNAHGDVIATFSELAQSTQPQTTAPMPTDYEDSMLQPDNV